MAIICCKPCSSCWTTATCCISTYATTARSGASTTCPAYLKKPTSWCAPRGCCRPAVPGLPGVDITVDKRLPMGGGLGGGSSDAATTLMALNHLWQAGLGREELMALGLKLGADVPFFIFGSNAFAEGVGEQLTAVDGLDCWFVVVEPGVSVPTPAIFCSPELTRNTKPVRIADFSGALQNAFGKNDMQAVAVRLFPEVDKAISLAWALRERKDDRVGRMCFHALPVGTASRCGTGGGFRNLESLEGERNCETSFGRFAEIVVKELV